MNMVGFYSNIKYVLFDFDDTLCVHSDHKSLSYEAYHAYGVNILNDKCAGEQLYPTSNASIHMHRFIETCQRFNIKIGLISHVGSVPQSIAKIKWAEEWYKTKFENFCVSTREQKVEMLKCISDNTGIERSQILIVDDAFPTLTEAADAGFMTATPMEIVNFIQSIMESDKLKLTPPRKTFRIHRRSHNSDNAYDPDFGDDRICKCGHSYVRHFDPYDNNRFVGCKYCGCDHFTEIKTVKK